MTKFIYFKEANDNEKVKSPVEPGLYRSGETETRQVSAFTVPGDPSGMVVVAYKLTWKERLWVLFTGRLWRAAFVAGATGKVVPHDCLQAVKPDFAEQEKLARQRIDNEAAVREARLRRSVDIGPPKAAKRIPAPGRRRKIKQGRTGGK